MNGRFVKTMLILGMGVLLLSGCATTAPMNVYKGALLQGSTKTGSLDSNEVWMFHGEKGNRVVISDAVDEGKVPPEIYLYPPDSSKYSVQSEAVSDRFQVLDHELEDSGDYVILVHHSEPQNVCSYKIAYTTISSDGSYLINPDDPKEDLIKVGNLTRTDSNKLFISRSRGLVPFMMIFNLATLGYGPYFFTAFSAADKVVGDAVDIHNRIEVAQKKIENPADHSTIMFATTRP